MYAKILKDRNDKFEEEMRNVNIVIDPDDPCPPGGFDSESDAQSNKNEEGTGIVDDLGGTDLPPNPSIEDKYDNYFNSYAAKAQIEGQEAEKKKKAGKLLWGSSITLRFQDVGMSIFSKVEEKMTLNGSPKPIFEVSIRGTCVDVRILELYQESTILIRQIYIWNYIIGLGDLGEKNKLGNKRGGPTKGIASTVSPHQRPNMQSPVSSHPQSVAGESWQESNPSTGQYKYNNPAQPLYSQPSYPPTPQKHQPITNTHNVSSGLFSSIRSKLFGGGDKVSQPVTPISANIYPANLGTERRMNYKNVEQNGSGRGSMKQTEHPYQGHPMPTSERAYARGSGVPGHNIPPGVSNRAPGPGAPVPGAPGKNPQRVPPSPQKKGELPLECFQDSSITIGKKCILQLLPSSLPPTTTAAKKEGHCIRIKVVERKGGEGQQAPGRQGGAPGEYLSQIYIGCIRVAVFTEVISSLVEVYESYKELYWYRDKSILEPFKHKIESTLQGFLSLKKLKGIYQRLKGEKDNLLTSERRRSLVQDLEGMGGMGGMGGIGNKNMEENTDSADIDDDIGAVGDMKKLVINSSLPHKKLGKELEPDNFIYKTVKKIDKKLATMSVSITLDISNASISCYEMKEIGAKSSKGSGPRSTLQLSPSPYFTLNTPIQKIAVRKQMDTLNVSVLGFETICTYSLPALYFLFMVIYIYIYIIYIYIYNILVIQDPTYNIHREPFPQPIY